jgi:hypothetical protein
MSLLNDASLILVPSAIKTGEVLVQKPLPNKFADETGNYDGNDPQTNANLTFTRASSATRVGPDGLIEKVRTNLLLQSNGFNTASWIKFAAGTALAPVVTANAGTAPDGANNAFRVQFDCVGTTSTDRSIVNQAITSVNSTPHASSVYIKAFSAGEVGKQVRFITEQSGSQIIITLTADWQRVVNVGTSVSQVETGDVMTDYIATTTAAVSVGPVSGLPRLDYLGSSCPRLLLEPQRTNLALYSEQIDNAGWTKQGLTITANSAVSPDGYTNADLLDDGTAASTQHWFFQGTTLANSTTYTLSLYAKYVSRQNMTINIFNGASSQYVLYNIQIQA